MRKQKEIKINFDRRRFNRYQREALDLCLLFERKGFQIFWVGGAVRDFLLKRENYDIDLATSATPVQIKRILSASRVKLYTLGEKFGTIGALLKDGNVEITTFRKEGDYRDYRHPSKVKFVNSAREDIMRRDFTINALLLDPKSGQIIDYVGGLKDLRSKTIRFVGNPSERINEDALRMLRAVRFAAALGFKIASKDLAAIKKHSASIKKVSGDRIKLELDKIISNDNFLKGIELLDKTGLLKHILPEVDNLKKVKQSKDFHAEGDAFIHTLYVLKNLQGSDLTLKYAALVHDIGKSGTARKKMRAGRAHISFLGHSQESMRMYQDIAKRLRFTHQEKEKIEYLILHHMDFLHPLQFERKSIIKWAKNKDFADLIRLRIADTAGSKMTDTTGSIKSKDIRPLLAILRFALKSPPLYQKNLLSGNDVMRILNLKPGKKVGEVLERIKEAQVEGKIKTKKQAQNYAKTLDNEF